MKKIILILIGIAAILSGVIFVLYENNQNKQEEVIDIFKDEEESNEKERADSKEDKEDITDKVIVDIKGMVANPGVYEVTSSSRVNDVIQLAGGLVEGADTSLINLAKIVSDEMTIIIYSRSEVLEKYKDEVCVCDCPEITNDACIDSSSSNDKILVNINTAAIEELTSIPSIGESKAEAIIKYREENGNFNSIEDIKNVSGIGETVFEKIKDYITV